MSHTTLNTIVTDVFIITLSTVLFPTLTQAAAKSDHQGYSKLLSRSTLSLSCLLIPISVITFIDAPHIVSIVYGRGQFDAAAVAGTAFVLMCYSPRFIFAGIREVFTRAFFAVQDTRTPMVISSIGIACNIIFSLAFIKPLKIAGIALGTVVSVFVMAVLLLYVAGRRFSGLSLSFICKNLLLQLAAGLISGLLLVFFKSLLPFDNHLLVFITDTIVGFSLFALIYLLLAGRIIPDIFPFANRFPFSILRNLSS